MKKSLIAVIVLCMAAGSGCMYDAYRQKMWENRYMQRQGPRPQMEAPEPAGIAEAPQEVMEGEFEEDAMPEGQPEIIERTQRKIYIEKPGEKELLDRKISVGLEFGNVYGNRNGAVDGNDDTDFENGMLIGLRATYLPAMWRSDFSPNFVTRYGLELRVENHSLMLSDRGMDLGKLNMSSTVFAFRLMQEPKEGDIFGFHFDVGMGWASTWFAKDTMLKQDDIANGWHTKVDTDQAQILAFGAGLDLMVGPESSVSLDLRYESVYVPVSWSVDGIYDTSIEWLDASSVRLILGFNFWF